MSFLKRHKEILSLAVLAVVFFFLYLFLYFNPSILSLPPIQTDRGPEPAYLILNQPDESVNYFFIRQLVLNNRFSYPESLSELTDNQVHPRSATVVHSALVPIGFPGMIVIYGFLLKIATLISGPRFFNLLAAAITPLLAVITPFFFYGFLRRIFDKSVAWLASILLFFLPAWWYYASRPFQHNTLFVFLIVALLYCYVVMRERFFLCHSRPAKCKGNPANIDNWIPAFAGMTNVCLPFLFGVLFGWAVYVRPSEIVWLAVLGLVLFFINSRGWSWREMLGLFSGLILAVVLFFATQTAFYGHPLGSGYVVPQAEGSAGLITAGPQNIPLLKSLILPFGFHPRTILHNVRAYFFDLFGIWTIFTLIGLSAIFAITILKDRLKEKYLILNIKYLILFIFFSLFLLIFYGSWSFYDNLLKIPSIGTSYVRYFLPIYVFSLPLAAWLIVWLWRRSRILKMAAAVLVAVLFLSSVREVFAPLEGLASVKKTIQTYQSWQTEIYQQTESRSVIVARYADKYLFPGRKIIPGWQEEEQIKAIGNLVGAGWPVYLYDLKLSEKEKTELENQLRTQGLKLSESIAGWEDLELRKILRY